MSITPSKQDMGGPIPADWKLSCLKCGYDLTGLTHRVCPECGTPFKPRQTWEANRAGVVPEEERQSDLPEKLILAGIVVGLVAISYWKGRPSAFVAAVVIVLGELWIRYTMVPPLVARILTGTICVIIAMWVFIK